MGILSGARRDLRYGLTTLTQYLGCIFRVVFGLEEDPEVGACEGQAC